MFSMLSILLTFERHRKARSVCRAMCSRYNSHGFGVWMPVGVPSAVTRPTQVWLGPGTLYACLDSILNKVIEQGRENTLVEGKADMAQNPATQTPNK